MKITDQVTHRVNRTSSGGLAPTLTMPSIFDVGLMISILEREGAEKVQRKQGVASESSGYQKELVSSNVVGKQSPSASASITQ